MKPGIIKTPSKPIPGCYFLSNSVAKEVVYAFSEIFKGLLRRSPKCFNLCLANGRDLAMKLVHGIGLSMFLLFFVLVQPVSSQQNIVMNTANAPPNATEDFQGIGDRVLREAFKRLGIHLKIVRLPSERALLNANDGIDDGNFARVAGLSKIYTNLIQVPEPITKFKFVAISKKDNLQITDWKSLRPYNVCIITGWKILEKNVTGTKTLTKVRNKEILFSLLLANRVDFIVYDKKQGMVVLNKLQINEGVYFLEPALAEKQMYPYLHKKHKDLVPRLTEAIRGLKADGTYHRILEEVLAPLWN